MILQQILEIVGSQEYILTGRLGGEVVVVLVGHRALTGHHVRSGSPEIFSKSGLSGSWTFSFLDTRLLKLLKIIEKKINTLLKRNCLFTFFKRRSFNLMNCNEIFKNINPDLVWSGRTCPANLGGRKLICPVQSILIL